MSDKIKIPSDEFDSIIYNKEIVVEDRIIDHRRGSVGHMVIFKHGDEFYRAHYSRAATENQDQYEPAEYECTRVVPVDRLVTVYEEA